MLTRSPDQYLHTRLPMKKRSLIASICTVGYCLCLEMGRWAREAREDKICQCCHQGAIEDERHALQACPASEQIKAQYPQRVVPNQHLHLLLSTDSVGGHGCISCAHLRHN